MFMVVCKYSFFFVDETTPLCIIESINERDLWHPQKGVNEEMKMVAFWVTAKETIDSITNKVAAHLGIDPSYVDSIMDEDQTTICSGSCYAARSAVTTYKVALQKPFVFVTRCICGDRDCRCAE